MENKFSDIEFLNAKLSEIEMSPDNSSWEKIKHGMDPINASLYENLNSIDLEPNANTRDFIFQQLSSENVIDGALYNKLVDLEVNPNESLANFEGNTWKYKRLLILLLLLLTFVSILFVHETDIEHQQGSIANQSRNEHDLEFQKGKDENQRLKEQNTVVPNGEKKSNEKPIKSQKQTFISGNEDRFNPINIDKNGPLNAELLNDELTINSKVSWTKNQINIHVEEFGSIGINQIKLDKKKFIKPRIFSLYLGIAYQNQNLKSSKIDQPEFQHKDALDNFNKSVGVRLKGFQISSYVNYTLGSKFYCRTGFNYNYSSATTQFDYIHNNIPVYGINGQIIGYFIRPNSASPNINQKISSTKNEVYMPIETFYQILKSKRLMVWGGIGLNVKLLSQFKSHDYSFDQEKIVAINPSSKQLLSPSISIQYQYFINSNTKIQIQLTGMTLQTKTIVDQMTINSKYFIPSISFGLSFSPKTP